MNELTGMTLTPFERALVAHLVADWLLQNSWMARHKGGLLHPAAWVHASIHGLCLGLALDVAAGVFLGLLHMLIDTRRPLRWWMRHIKSTPDDQESATVAVWADQVMHIASIAVWITWLSP